MGRLDLFVADIISTPWAVLPARGSVMLRVLLRRASGLRLSDWEVEEVIGRDRDRYAARREGDARMSGRGVAVLPIFGLLVHREHEAANVSGGGMVSTEGIATAFRAVIADPQVGTIVLDIDSPGGSVFGVEELADVIAASEKPVVAVANALAASGAYWIAAQANEVIVTPSGEIGSIGVYAVHEDISKAMEMEGITPTIISAGRYKVEGNPLAPFTAEARTAIQARVDDYYSAFVRAVARGRGVTPSAARGGFAEGRVVGAEEAVALGMADRIATLDETVARIMDGGRVRKRPAQAAVAPTEAQQVSGSSRDGTQATTIHVSAEACVLPAEAGTKPLAVDDTDTRERELALITPQAGFESSAN